MRRFGAAGHLAALAATLLVFGPTTGAAEASDVFAIEGAKVHTGAASGTLAEATIVVRGRRVVAVGPEAEVPDDAVRIDARGKVVTPGLVDSMSALGLTEISLEDPTQDNRTDSPRLGAAFRLDDAINPSSTLIPINRVEGLTRVMVAPRSSEGPIAGQAAVIHLGSGAPVVRSPAALVVALGQRGAARAGGSRAAALALVSEALADARDFAEHREEYERAGRRPYALGRLDLEALAPVLDGQIPIAAWVHRASDIRAALRLAEEHRVRLVVVGGAEAWLVAEELAAARVPVVLDPLANLPSNFEQLGATLENAARLHAAGVPVAFTTGSSHNARNLRQAAGNAVANGLPWDAALAAMTTVPAEIWGIPEFGSIEPGMEADLVVWDGDPLEVTTAAERVWIRGWEVPMVSRQILLRERYRDLGGEMPPAYVRPEGP